MSANNQTNPGHVARRARIANGRTDVVMGVLYFPLSTDQLMIPPQTKINLSLQKSPMEFLLKRRNNNNQYRVNFISLQWHLRKVRYTESISKSVNQVLATNQGGIMPLNYNFPSNHTLTADQQAFDLQVSSGKIPYEIVIGITTTAQFMGHLTLNPFEYNHNNLQEIQLKVEDQTIPLEPLKMDFANDLYVEMYRNTMRSLGQYGRQITNNLSYANFPNGFCFYIFNLRTDESNSLTYYPEEKQGTIRLLLKFNGNLTEAHTVFLIRSYNNHLSVSRNRAYTGNMLTY